ncbi:hypothetical protein I6F11_26555 [Ensifer sp. NBAIM29]|nr:hypothetical protein [Ensifer sp. NBAIM29]
MDESGNTGDLCKVGAHPHFGGQRMFTLACIGGDDLGALSAEIDRLKVLHRLQGGELKSTRTKAKPKFVSDVARFLREKEWPVFLELVDKHYFIIMCIVERIVMPYVSEADLSPGSMLVKNEMADYMALCGPDELAQLYAIACQSQKRPDARQVFLRLIKWSRNSRARRDIAEGLERFTRASLKDFEKLHPFKAVEQALPIPDRTKRDGRVWLLPNISSFTNIYARLNQHLKGDIENVTFIHDEQVHFDDIIGANKVLAESLGQHLPRYVYQKLWEPSTVDPDHDEAFNEIDRFTRSGGVTGINYVAPKALIRSLGLLPGSNL